MKREKLQISKPELAVPLSCRAEFVLVEFDFPQDYDSLLDPFAKEMGIDYPLYFPEEAFCPESGKLICFLESDWTDESTRDSFFGMSSDKLLPKMPMVKPDTEEFSRFIDCKDYSPEGLLNIISYYSPLFVPYAASQRRFIDYRYHDPSFPKDSPHRYESTYRQSHRRRKANKPLDILQEVADDIYLAYIRQSYRDLEDYSEIRPFLDAAVLSEYARRTHLAQKDIYEGGLISYYEVLVTAKALRHSIAELLDWDAAYTNFKKYKTNLLISLEKGNFHSGEHVDSDNESFIKSILKQIEELFSCEERIEEGQVAHETLNLIEFQMKPHLQFLMHCVFQTEEASMQNLLRRSPSFEEIYPDRLSVTINPFTTSDFIQQANPQYLTNRYAEGSQSAQIAAQFLNALAEDEPWKRCKYLSCNRLFKYKRTSSNKQAERKRAGDYCSDECANKLRNTLYYKEDAIIKKGADQGLAPSEILKELRAKKGDDDEWVDLKSPEKTEERWRTKIKRVQQNVSSK